MSGLLSITAGHPGPLPDHQERVLSTNTATIAVPAQALRRHSIIPSASAERRGPYRLAASCTGAIAAPAVSPLRQDGPGSRLALAKRRPGAASSAPPKSRRMLGLYALKPWFTGILTPIVNAAVARRISPDVFTAAGVVAAGAGAVAVGLGCWPLAAVFMVLRLAGANLDGAVARAAERSRPWGFVINEVGDRASDVLAFAGLAVWAARQGGPGMHWLSWPVIMVLLAALASTLPTFAALAAAGAGATRPNGGPLGKTERCLFIVVASAFPVVLPVVSMQMINGSLLTTVLRLRAAHRELAAARPSAAD